MGADLIKDVLAQFEKRKTISCATLTKLFGENLGETLAKLVEQDLITVDTLIEGKGKSIWKLK